MENHDPIKKLELITEFMQIVKDQPKNDVDLLLELAERTRTAGYLVLADDIEEIAARFIREDYQINNEIKDILRS